MGKRIIRAMDAVLNGIIIAICAALLFVSGYSLLDNYWLYKNASDDSLLDYKPPEPVQAEATAAAAEPEPEAQAGDGAEIAFISDKQKGWLQLYDTPIDYPLMQGEDNFEFLNLDPYGEFKLSGSIFMDYRNDPSLADAYTLIHGHHMEYGSMFGSLDAFTERDYFDAHREGRIVTREGSYELRLFAVSGGEGDDQTLFNPQNTTVEKITAYLKENAMIYDDFDPNDKIVALATCWGETESSRLLVFGAAHKI